MLVQKCNHFIITYKWIICIIPVIPAHRREKYGADIKQHPRKKSVSIASSANRKISREAEKLHRIAALCQQDQLLFQIKRNHEMKVEKMTERHLSRIHELQIEKYEFELRKAKAEAELAEFLLAKEKNDV